MTALVVALFVINVFGFIFVLKQGEKNMLSPEFQAQFARATAALSALAAKPPPADGGPEATASMKQVADQLEALAAPPAPPAAAS